MIAKWEKEDEYEEGQASQQFQNSTCKDKEDFKQSEKASVPQAPTN